MSPITLYIVLKYLVDNCPLTPLILSKTSKKRPFWPVFLQLRPVSGQQCPDGWSDGQNYFLRTRRNKFDIDRYTIDAYPISQFLTLRGHPNRQTDRQTHRHTDKHPYSINIYRLGLRPSTPSMLVSQAKYSVKVSLHAYDHYLWAFGPYTYLNLPYRQ